MVMERGGAAFAQQFGIDGLLGFPGEDIGKKVLERGTLGSGQQPTEYAARQAGAVDSKEQRSGSIGQLDGALSGKGEVPHGYEITEVGVFRQDRIGLVGGNPQLRVLHRQVHLVDLQFVEQAPRIGPAGLQA